MKKNKKDFIYLFLTILIFMGVNYVVVFYMDNTYKMAVLTIILSLGLAALLYKELGGGSLKYIEEHLSNLSNMDFTISEDTSIPKEIEEELNNLSIKIKNNLKNQVEISTDIFNVCEQLNAVSQESVASAEYIASSVEVADSNTIEQFHMLNKTNDLTQEIYLSLDNIEKDIVDKINFIAEAITTAQNGIENIQKIEERINLSKNMVEKSSEKVIKLRDYSDEIVGLIDLINSISKETNMLSLNASIEAARAGEHGKGFAIVAMEVGKLAKETENVSSKIEEVIYTLKGEVSSITESMENEMNYMEENCSVMEITNKEFGSIIETLNKGKESLEGITDVTKENNTIIGDVTTNIDKITSFSEEIATHMEETTAQVVEQHTRAKYLQEIVENIRNNVYNMQQVVAGKVMEERMLKEAYYIREYFKDNSHVDDNIIEEILSKTGMDALYLTDSLGVVKYSNAKSSLGLNLYEADSSFLALKEGKQEYIVTPIKARVEDGKLFKFLTVADSNKRLYEVGLSLETLLNNM